MINIFKKIIMLHKIKDTVRWLSKAGNFIWLGNNEDKMYCSHSFYPISISVYKDHNFKQQIFSIRIDNIHGKEYINIQDYAVLITDGCKIFKLLDKIKQLAKEDIKGTKAYYYNKELKILSGD